MKCLAEKLRTAYLPIVMLETATTRPPRRRHPGPGKTLGRPPARKVRLTVKVSPAISAAIRACAKEDGTTISQVVASQFLAVS